MELMHMVDMEPFRIVVVCWKNGVDVVLERQNRVNGLHGISPVAGGHEEGARNAWDPGPQRIGCNVHHSIAYHD